MARSFRRIKAAGTYGILTAEAVDEGKWGNKIMILRDHQLPEKMQLREKLGDRVYCAKSPAGFLGGDLVSFHGEVNRLWQFMAAKSPWRKNYGKSGR